MTNDIIANFMVRAKAYRSILTVGVETATEAMLHARHMEAEGLSDVVIQDRAGHALEAHRLARLVQFETLQPPSLPH